VNLPSKFHSKIKNFYSHGKLEEDCNIKIKEINKIIEKLNFMKKYLNV